MGNTRCLRVRRSGAIMAERFGMNHAALDGAHRSIMTAPRDRDDCVDLLLAAIHDIADFDDIHQAAERLDAVRVWIREEARAAAADPIFEDEADSDLHINSVTA